jgi:hypothetical protein
VVPGHGDVGDKNCISEMYETVTIWMDAVKDAIAKGMTFEDAQKKVTMAKQFPNMSQDERTAGIIRMNVARLYEALKK